MLARALYSDPAVLFMDEGTANLDPVSEAAVVETLVKMPAVRVVSGLRSMLIHAATRIFDVNGGRVFQVDKQAKIETVSSTANL